MCKNRQTGPTTSASCPRAMTLRPPSHIICISSLPSSTFEYPQTLLLGTRDDVRGRKEEEDGKYYHRAQRFRSCFVDRPPREPRRLEVVSKGREVSNPLVLHTQLSCSPSGVSVEIYHQTRAVSGNSWWSSARGFVQCREYISRPADTTPGLLTRSPPQPPSRRRS